ncbi:la protein homolog [Condylostylus longicornis]|uniref:la protein homolog n=1 Tax=Condylostylus longicornis TaxID=2530218 RepID=UPI00244E0C6D|nr:la protein homolog [Condylostylus longicornis]
MSDTESKSNDEAPLNEKSENGNSTENNEDNTEKTKDNSTEGKESINNDKSEVTSKLEADIIRQIEYYFGDANLQRDKFLLEQISKTEEGWVPFSVLLTFKRLASLSTDVEEIVNAIMKSDEGLLEVSDDKTKVRRHPERPIPEYNEERRKEIHSRTAYVKGFPLDSEMSDLIDYFNPYEKVVNITMRKYLDKPTKSYKFKGSVFVTFAKKEQCEEFINKEKVQFNERDLIRKWQEKYVEEKREEIKSKKLKKGNKKEEDENKIQLPKGALIHFDGVTDETLKREKIKENLEELGAQIAFIEYNKGDKSGYIRLAVEDSAKLILDKIENNKLKLKGTEVELTLKLVEGDEEKEILKKAVESMQSRRNNTRQHSKGGFNKGGGHNRKRKQNRRDNQTDDIEGDDGEPPAKQEKEVN